VILQRVAVSREVELLDEIPDVLGRQGGSEDISDGLLLVADGADPLVAGLLLLLHLVKREGRSRRRTRSRGSRPDTEGGREEQQRQGRYLHHEAIVALQGEEGRHLPVLCSDSVLCSSVLFCSVLFCFCQNFKLSKSQNFRISKPFRSIFFRQLNNSD
jgi:hypothetical protein